ncbi:hypothetical protein [Synechocystis sp. PCC 7509]|uniref:hypothetical protein n=1 Tax=Synechocystis sp. PCC 7509 TaxID=927677 RepID=UPI0002AC7ABD|nr:hypothetical protein [Synechocystis sp. PCC 7509]
MKLLTKTLYVCLTTVASISALSTNAMAGEGGAAGSAAFTIVEGSVTGVALAAAIGKQTAFAGAFNDAFLEENTAFAYGSAGVITIRGLAPLAINSVSSVGDPALDIPQSNSFGDSTTVLIGSGI